MLDTHITLQGAAHNGKRMFGILTDFMQLCDTSPLSFLKIKPSTYQDYNSEQAKSSCSCSCLEN